VSFGLPIAADTVGEFVRGVYSRGFAFPAEPILPKFRPNAPRREFADSISCFLENADGLTAHFRNPWDRNARIVMGRISGYRPLSSGSSFPLPLTIAYTYCGNA
jgi:hypothetical protein